MKKDPLYFIALIPPDPIAEEVKDFKKLVAKRYQSRRALNSPAHITLQPPFRWPDERLDALKSTLRAFAQTQDPFYQDLLDFDCFKPRVVFVDIVLNEALELLVEDLKEVLIPLLGEDQIDTRPYHPHMTIAFKDLKPHFFYRAWEYFSEQEYERTFEANAFYLLKHNGREWEILQEFKLGAANN